MQLCRFLLAIQVAWDLPRVPVELLTKFLDGGLRIMLAIQLEHLKYTRKEVRKRGEFLNQFELSGHQPGMTYIVANTFVEVAFWTY